VRTQSTAHAIRYARTQAHMYRMGDGWVVTHWSPPYQAWWDDQPTNYRSARNRLSETLAEIACDALGIPALWDGSGRWTDYVADRARGIQ
jgi:hypothetical protein